MERRKSSLLPDSSPAARAEGRNGKHVTLRCVARGLGDCRHRQEVDEFRKIVIADGISFSAITFQNVIGYLQEHLSSHDNYVAYLVERYLFPYGVDYNPSGLRINQ